jgi:hypothetical protein
MRGPTAVGLGMRHTTKDEGITRTYRFWARPLGGVPSELWQIALNSQRFWNELVEFRDNVAFNSETLPENAEGYERAFGIFSQAAKLTVRDGASLLSEHTTYHGQREMPCLTASLTAVAEPLKNNVVGHICITA